MRIYIDIENVNRVQLNIDALQRAIDDKKVATDNILLIDTKSILEGIKKTIGCGGRIKYIETD